MKKILVIDDSALMRKHLRQMLEEGGYEVFTARNGEEGLEKIRTLSPDAVTLDINMPVMDGLTCLSHIMTDSPLPVLMVSSLTEKGALATFEALQLGALDYVAKPGGTVSLNMQSVKDDLLLKIEAVANSKAFSGKAHGLRDRLRKQREEIVARPRPETEREVRVSREARSNPDSGIVVIGVSTGGPGTLEEIITQLPADFPWPVLIAQHMPARFTRVFSERLNGQCRIEVAELERATELVPGQVLVARGDADVKLVQRRSKILATSIPSRSQYLWHPSVELMVESAGECYEPESIICVQLTGMGNDGAEAMARLNRQGARTIAQSEESCVVFGMPKELIDRGGADVVLPTEKVAQQLVDWVY
ncbi:MAG: chemotaxis-specific protein-glutamate methyltransferase CheB [Candidatus Thiodiazotropha sp.]